PAPTGMYQPRYAAQAPKPAVQPEVPGKDAAGAGGAEAGEGGRRRRPRIADPEVDKAAPVLPSPACVYPIDLESAWALAGVENPTIAIAREAVREGLALLLEARALLL